MIDDDAPADTPGSTPPEKIDDRPNVGTVSPSDYPAGRKDSEHPAGADEQREYERLNPGSGSDGASE